VPDPSFELGALSDEALLGCTAAGDREAFAQLVTRLEACVFRYARALATDHQEAEDLLQQTFLAALGSAGRFRGESSVRTWLFTIARHAAFRARARRDREPLDPVPLDELGRLAGWGQPDPEQALMAAERRARLMAALESLAPDDREILTLRDLEGHSGEEVAALLGLGVAAMKSRLHRARLRLAASVRKGDHDADG
jgi:RNA polymerase sigma-70 factor, ECF subfamily